MLWFVLIITFIITFEKVEFQESSKIKAFITFLERLSIIISSGEFVSSKPEVTRKNAMRAFMELRLQAKENFPQGMSLDEINEEIRKARYGEEDVQ